MRTKTISFLLVLYSLMGVSQGLINSSIHSLLLDTERDIQISLPTTYDSDSIKSYPLTIVLDAEYLFDIYNANAKLFASKGKAPEQIIVGISMNETRKNDIFYNVANGKLNAENRKFYEFIRDELIFHMESNYRTTPFVTLVGEGVSANFITHYLQEKLSPINAYICINPSFSDFIGGQLQSYNLSDLEKHDTLFYFYTNNSSSFSLKKRTKISQLQNALVTKELRNLKIINDNIESYSSVSTMSEAIPRAILNIFKLFAPISKDEFENYISILSPIEAIGYLENKYLEIQYHFDSTIGIRERDIYVIEDIIIDKNEGEYLREFGKMILKMFPTSPLSEYYHGLYFEKKDNYKKALDYYKIGYGKMDPSDPNADKFYENIIRITTN